MDHDGRQSPAAQDKDKTGVLQKRLRNKESGHRRASQCFTDRGFLGNAVHTDTNSNARMAG